MLVHAEPEQSCHWYAYELGLFDHEPVLALNVCPCRAMPLIAGGVTLTGGSVGTLLVWVEPVVGVPTVVWAPRTYAEMKQPRDRWAPLPQSGRARRWSSARILLVQEPP